MPCLDCLDVNYLIPFFLFLSDIYRAGNLVGSSMGTEVTSDVTSSGPVKLADLQRILSNIGPAGATQFFL